MIVKGIVFDINGTMTDILTNEADDHVYRVISNLFSYQGILLDPATTKDLYFRIQREQRAAAHETYPEFDAIEIFREIIRQHSTDFTRSLPAAKLEQLPGFFAETYRAASRFRLHLYPGVDSTIRQLHRNYRLAVVSDAQTAYAIPELNAVGLSGYFDPIIVSGDYGYRKPDERVFTAALNAMGMDASEVLYVGNDMHCDVYGAKRLGIRTVFFKSNQGHHEMEGVEPDYIIYHFPELLNAVRFFESR
ncbi:MAG: HAD family hydrolase [Propionivibrio sp.]|uniref:HAD family hydrolase n=1 Tax=Propionivibrio sp. TaxID=2212460 RepID=UPI001A4EE89C|nr:HAD family hydrolase [Propionivibrio sp.]MBL8415840.1 HAD family hydrolase [Propionivibrio sp.]